MIWSNNSVWAINILSLSLNVASCILLEKSLTENWKVVFFTIYKETLVKTIRSNLTKTCRIFPTYTESLYV